jgi:glycosyltransferase involved in cell wall biosynthesis
MIAAQDEAICISKATADAYEAWIQNNKVATATTFRTDWVHMGADLNGSQPSRGLPADASETLRVLESRPSFLTVSTLEPRKAQSQILDAVEALWSADEDVNLVFVGQQGWKIDDLVNRIDNHPENGKRLFWLKGISDEYLDRVYQNSTCLIAASMNEGFGLPLIEAARHSVPVIARDIPVFREVAEENVFYFSGESGEQLASAMSQWLRCYRDGTAPQSTGMRWLTWEQSTEQLKVGLIDTHYPRRQLLVDISELVRRDALTGIQRVVRNVLQELLAKPPAGYKIEPVYADLTQDYRYARAYTARLLGAPEPAIEDDLVEYTAGDAFLGLDFQPQIVAARVDTLRDMRRRGVQVSFVVYDLIPVRLPECFVPGTTEGFFRWLDVVTEVADTAVCISRTVACQLDEWVREYGLVRTRRMAIKWFYLGADPLPSIPIATQPRVFTDPADVPVFLMVGTVEPRKGHAVVLDAFELLWSHGIAARLVIAGKQGWLVDKLAQRIETHPAAGNTLHWYRQVDDAELEALYASASCLIAASYEEGFGLPLIEAALREVPVIARDLPVFREVAEDGAHYFPAADDGSLYDHLIKWIKLRERGEIPDPRQIRVNTWAESTDSLKAQLSLKEIY